MSVQENISKNRIREVLRQLPQRLPDPPAAVAGRFELPAKLREKSPKILPDELEINAISKRMGFFLGILQTVKVRLVTSAEFAARGGNPKQAAGKYLRFNNHTPEILLLKNPAFNLNHLLAILAHEYTHNYLAHHQIQERQVFENELLTDLTAIFLGFGEWLWKGYQPFRTSDGSEGGEKMEKITRLGYVPAPLIPFAMAESGLIRNLPDLVKGLPFWNFHRIQTQILLGKKKYVQGRKRNLQSQLKSDLTQLSEDWNQLRQWGPDALNRSIKTRELLASQKEWVELAHALSLNEVKNHLEEIHRQLEKNPDAVSELSLKMKVLRRRMNRWQKLLTPFRVGDEQEIV